MTKSVLRGLVWQSEESLSDPRGVHGCKSKRSFGLNIVLDLISDGFWNFKNTEFLIKERHSSIGIVFHVHIFMAAIIILFPPRPLWQRRCRNHVNDPPVRTSPPRRLGDRFYWRRARAGKATAVIVPLVLSRVQSERQWTRQIGVSIIEMHSLSQSWTWENEQQ